MQFMGSDFRPQVAAFDGDLGPGAAVDRMMRLATMALDDLVSVLPPVPDGPLTVAIALPEVAPREGLDAHSLGDLEQDLAARAIRRLALPAGGASVHPGADPHLPLTRMVTPDLTGRFSSLRWIRLPAADGLPFASMRAG